MRANEAAFIALVTNELEPLRNIAERLGMTQEKAMEFATYLIRENKIRGRYVPVEGHGQIFCVVKGMESDELVIAKENLDIANKALELSTKSLEIATKSLEIANKGLNITVETKTIAIQSKKWTKRNTIWLIILGVLGIVTTIWVAFLK